MDAAAKTRILSKLSRIVTSFSNNKVCLPTTFLSCSLIINELEGKYC